MKVRICGLAIAAFVSCFLASAATATSPLYTITDLGFSNGVGINNSGVVVGGSGGYVFLSNGTTMTNLGALGIPTAINASDEVTGFTPGAVEQGFLYNGTTTINIGTLGGSTEAYGINASGEVVGASFLTKPPGQPSQFDAFLYDGTTMTDLGDGPCGSDAISGSPTNAYAYGINDSGEIAGTSINPRAHGGCIRAFLYNGSATIAIPTLGGDFNDAYAINNNGEVTGRSLTAGNKSYNAFLYNRTTTIDLGTLGGTINGAVGLAINDSGEVVGQSQLAAGGEHAFLYDGSSMLDLNNLIAVTDPLYNEVVFYSATGINDTGQIVANGCYISGPLNGRCHAFRLDPVPVLAGTPGKSNCHGQSVAALVSHFEAGVQNCAL
jgi:probable HAF family extracellular repeat protein